MCYSAKEMKLSKEMLRSKLLPEAELGKFRGEANRKVWAQQGWRLRCWKATKLPFWKRIVPRLEIKEMVVECDDWWQGWMEMLVMAQARAKGGTSSLMDKTVLIWH